MTQNRLNLNQTTRKIDAVRKVGPNVKANALMNKLLSNGGSCASLVSGPVGLRNVARLGLLLTVIATVTTPAAAQFPFRQPENFRQPQSPYEPLRQRGFDHYQKGEYAQAINVATQVLNFEPEDPISFYLRASAKIELGRQAGDGKQIRDGIQDARRALAIRGADDKFANLYIPYLYGMSSLAIVEGKVSHAEIAVKTAGTAIDKPDVENSDKSNLLYQRAFAREQANAVAAAAFNRSSATPEEIEAFEASQADRRQAAIEDYRRAVQLNPKQMGSHINLAKLLSANGDAAGAEKAFVAAIAEFPRNATIYNERGVFYRQQGRLDEAIADFTQSVEIQRDFVMGYINRGFCLSDKGEVEAAEADYEMAVRLSPKMSLAYQLRGTARMTLGKAGGAVSDFSRQIELNSQDATAFENRGFARFFAGQFAEAATDFQRALQLQPTAVHLAVWRAVALQRAGEAETAQNELRALMDSDAAPRGWVAHLSRYLLGEMSAEDLVAATKAVQNDNIAKAQLCEAEFFIGQQQQLAGDEAAANAHFQAAVATDVRYLSAFRGARYELGQFARQ